jgi:hypothetical protein
MSGLDAEQLDALEQRVGDLLTQPWDQGTGRPQELTLREALVVTSGYMRQNIIEEVWAEIFDVDHGRQPEGMADTLHGLQKATEDLLVLVSGRHRPVLLQGGFCINLIVLLLLIIPWAGLDARPPQLLRNDPASGNYRVEAGQNPKSG